MNKFLILIVSMLFGIGGCAFAPKNPASHKVEVEEHLLRVNRNGYLIPSDFAMQNPLSRDSTKASLSFNEVEIKYTKIWEQAISLACLKQTKFKQKQCFDSFQSYFLDPNNDKYFSNSEGEAVKDTPIKLLVYFHGGLNTYSDSDERVENHVSYIEDIKTNSNTNPDWHYPIFVSWPSNLLGTIGEHLLWEREGRVTSTGTGLISTPFIIFEDVVSSIGELPSNFYFQFTNDKDRYASGTNLSKYLTSSIWEEAYYKYQNLNFQEPLTSDYLRSKYHSGRLNSDMKNIAINRSIYSRSGFKHRAESAGTLLFTPFRYVVGSLWNGAIAANSWDMMKRRARSMFYPHGDFDKRMKAQSGEHLGTFFEFILNKEKSYPALDIELTLIGHSMGTIAINNLLSKYKQDWEETSILKDIVYMAAAANINDTLSIVPTILRNNINDIGFHNLTLNRVAESAEVYGYGLLPSGSLLVSIDKYHDSPEHHLLRTMGTELNVHSSLDVITEAFSGMTDPVSFKSFNSINHSLPKKHGDFGCILYWKSSTWDIRNEEGHTPKPGEELCE
ncbi:hypothetical protein [Pseudoalteromonas phenolica]|uniref:hypothetical protein n=1 Tax=Pseudoalteromonas phenolica TaxID=161398 RepID=UPI00384C2AD9